MSNRMFLRRLTLLSLLNSSQSSIRPVVHSLVGVSRITRSPGVLFGNATNASMNNIRNYHWGPTKLGSVSLVLPREGHPKFEIETAEYKRRNKTLNRARFRQKMIREVHIRYLANKQDPRRLPVKGAKKPKFKRVLWKLKEKLERTKTKEAYLIRKLKRFEVPQDQGPIVKPHELTGEERFYLERMGQKNKRANYAPVGRRGIFGGVILNIHTHWKRHETVKVIFKNCTPEKMEEYKNEIARLSGGLPLQTIGDNTIVFYRGKYYRQPDVMSPIDTLSKRKAYKRSIYEQSLESARHVIKIVEKELELYYRHEALYDAPCNHNPHTSLEHSTSSTDQERPKDSSVADVRPQVHPTSEAADLACQERTEVCNNVILLHE